MNGRGTMRAIVLLLLLVTPACSGVGPFAPLVSSGNVTVGPSNPVLNAIGATVQLRLIESDIQTAQVVDVTWSSNNPSVVSVSDTGLATAVGDGTATIMARVGDQTGSVQITVAATIINTIRITSLDQTDTNTVNNTATVSITIIAN
jgi:uncharacterized protein YjdB